MHLHPTKGWQGLRNARKKKANRRLKVGPADQPRKRGYLMAKRLMQVQARELVGHGDGKRATPAGRGSTLFKIEPWVPPENRIKAIRERHIHPRRLRANAG